jgi:catechol 2,3-dioxygenase-like lactoylglutathione lyase family enzyme
MSDKPRLKSLAPQFLVDDLDRSIAHYRDVLGFAFGELWGGFYAIGARDDFELHLKCAPKNAAEFHADCVAKGATIIKPLAATTWGTRDFYLLDPDGYVLCFGG